MPLWHILSPHSGVFELTKMINRPMQKFDRMTMTFNMQKFAEGQNAAFDALESARWSFGETAMHEIFQIKDFLK
jgi:hypothetical protein